MIISKRELTDDTHPIIGERDLILDIETTGFSPKYAAIYMIGFVHRDQHSLYTEQWFTEKPSDEYELLYRFRQVLENHPNLWYYNGDRFDMPFIKHRMTEYGLTCPDYNSQDLMKLARPFKKSLGLENLKLKTLEAFFGYKREDPFSGGDLTHLYKTYLDAPDDRLLQTLLLHNYEDLLGLSEVMAHLDLFQLLENYKAGTQTIRLSHATLEDAQLIMKFPVNVSGTYTIKLPFLRLLLQDGLATAEVEVIKDQMYYFFPDPSNYHYLVHEDFAVHKSIGQFVEKSHRKQATSMNAYVRKEGLFLPSNRKYNLQTPLYYLESEKIHAYVDLQDLIADDLLVDYLTRMLMAI